MEVFLGIIVTLAALAVFGPPVPKVHIGACPADTVWFHIKTRTDYLGGIPVEVTDTTWVIRSGDAR